MKKSEHFEREINLIMDENLRSIVRRYLDELVPDYFWTDGASSSGKYHPAFAQGIGGLVRHTKAVVMFAEELLRMSSYAFMKDNYKDYVIAACIVHDTIKFGFTNELDKTMYKDHAKNAAIAFKNFCKECGALYPNPSEFMLNAVSAHMGQWSTDKDDRPFTNVDRCVHLADYMASRSFIDIPQITAEWNAIEGNDDDLPF